MPNSNAPWRDFFNSKSSKPQSSSNYQVQTSSAPVSVPNQTQAPTPTPQYVKPTMTPQQMREAKLLGINDDNNMLTPQQNREMKLLTQDDVKSIQPTANTSMMDRVDMKNSPSKYYVPNTPPQDIQWDKVLNTSESQAPLKTDMPRLNYGAKAQTQTKLTDDFYNAIMQGIYGIDAAITNLPRVALQGSSNLMDKILPDSMYDPNKNTVLNKLNDTVGMYENLQNQYNQKLEDLTGARKFLTTGVEALPQLALPMGMSKTLGNMAERTAMEIAPNAFRIAPKTMEMLPFGLQAGSQYQREAENDGANYIQSLAYGLAGGIAEAVSEAPILTNWMDAGAGKLIPKGAKTLMEKYGPTAMEFLKDIPKEMFQEMAVDPMTGLAKKLTYKPDMPLVGQGGVIYFSQMGQDAYGGAAMAVIIGALGLPTSALAHKMASKTIEEGVPPTPEVLNQIKTQADSDYAALQSQQSQPTTENVQPISEPQTVNIQGVGPSKIVSEQGNDVVLQTPNGTVTVKKDTLPTIIEQPTINQTMESVNQQNNTQNIQEPQTVQQEPMQNSPTQSNLNETDKKGSVGSLEQATSQNAPKFEVGESISFKHDNGKQITGKITRQHNNIYDVESKDSKGKMQRYVVDASKPERNVMRTASQEAQNKFKKALKSINKNGMNFNASLVDSENNFHKDIKNTMKGLGVNVEFYNVKSGTDVHGFMFDKDSNTLYIKHTNDKNDMVATVGHEFLHHVKKNYKEDYSKLHEFAKSYFSDEAKQKFLDTYKNTPELQKQLSQDENALLEEMLADELGNNFTNKNFWEKLYSHSKELFEKLVKVARDMVSQISGTKYQTYVASEISKNLSKEFEKTIQSVRAKVVAEETVKKSEIQSLEEAGIAVADDKTSIAPISYSVRTWTQESKDKIVKFADKNGIASEREVLTYLKDIDNVMAKILEDPERLDYEASELYSALKPNSDTHYKESVDFSTLCKKRLVLQGTIEELQSKLERGLTEDEWLDVRKGLNDSGIEVSCGLCYVDARRIIMGQRTNEYIEENMNKNNWYQKTTQDKGIPYPKEHPPVQYFLTQEGMDQMKREYPEIYEDFRNKLNASSKIKTPESRTEYRGEILDPKKLSQSRVDTLNHHAGLRLQSWSDFETPHLIDGMQVIADMFARGLKGHAYTKVENFVRAFGKTGLMINMSLIPKGMGLDEKGELVFDNVEGMDFNVTKKYKKLFPKTVGNITIGVTDAQIRAAMRSKFIDYIIPYHASGMSMAKRIAMGIGIEKWTDYTEYQNPRPRNEEAKRWGKLVPDVYDNWDYSKSPKENADAYVKALDELGWDAPFIQFKDEEGYWKVLIDHKMIDENGQNIIQETVKPIFDMDAVNDILDSYTGGHNKLPVHNPTLEKLTKKFDFMDKIRDGITIPYAHNASKSPKLANDEFAQSIEPSGEYMIHDEMNSKYKLPNWEYGTITFNKPYVIEHNSSGHGGWKTLLSAKFEGKKGKALTNALIKEGYDAVVTVDSDKHQYNEIVNLKGVKGTEDVKLSARSKQTETEEFKRWFKDSKVVNENGEPLKVYHGTKSNEIFNTFRIPKDSSETVNGWDFEDSTLGAFFTDNADMTNEFNQNYYDDDKGRIYPTYLSVQKPYTVSNFEELERNINKYGDAFKMRLELQKQGYDGVIVEENKYKHMRYNGGTYIVFEPTQIKSATGNNGDFNSENPDIRYSARQKEASINDIEAKYNIATSNSNGVYSLVNSSGVKLDGFDSEEELKSYVSKNGKDIKNLKRLYDLNQELRDLNLKKVFARSDASKEKIISNIEKLKSKIARTEELMSENQERINAHAPKELTITSRMEYLPDDAKLPNVAIKMKGYRGRPKEDGYSNSARYGKAKYYSNMRSVAETWSKYRGEGAFVEEKDIILNKPFVDDFDVQLDKETKDRFYKAFEDAGLSKSDIDKAFDGEFAWKSDKWDTPLEALRTMMTGTDGNFFRNGTKLGEILKSIGFDGVVSILKSERVIEVAVYPKEDVKQSVREKETREAYDWETEVTSDDKTIADEEIKSSKGKSKINTVNGTGTTKKRSEIIQGIIEAIDIPLRVGRLNAHGAEGIYKERSEVIRTKLADDMPTIFHEVGHHLDKLYSLLSTSSNASIKKELMELGKIQAQLQKLKTDDDQMQEGIAEYVRTYIEDNTLAEQLAPEFTKVFKKRLEPKVMKAIDTAVKDFYDYTHAEASERVNSAISTSNPSIKKKFNAMIKDISSAKNYKDGFDKFIYYVFDDLRPYQTLVNTIKKINGLKNIPALEDVYKQARLLRGWSSKAENALKRGIFDENNNKVSDGFEQILKPVMGQLDDFRAYIVAKRVVEKAKQHINTGVDVQDAIDTVEKFKDNKDFVDAHEKLKNYQRELLNRLVESGMLSSEQVKQIESKNAEYVPFYRVFEENDKSIGGGKTVVNLGTAVKRMKGSNRTIQDPLESIIKNTFYYINLADRNNVGRTLVNWVTKYEGNGKYVEKVTPKFGATNVSVDEISKQLEAFGADLSQVDLTQVATIFRPLMNPTAAENVITVWQNGKKELYQVSKELYEATLNLDAYHMNMFAKIMNYPVRMLRGGSVLAPEFGGRNLIRDAFSTVVNSAYGFVPGYDTLRGLFHVVMRDDLYQKWLSDNSGGGSSVGFDRQHLQETLKHMRTNADFKKLFIHYANPLHWLEILRALSELSESATKLGEYTKGLAKETLKENNSYGILKDPMLYLQTQLIPELVLKQYKPSKNARAEAAYNTRDLMDFSMGGRFSKELNSYSAFFNAQLVGIYKTVRKFKDDPFGATLRVVLGITALSLYLWSKNHDDDRYKKLSQRDKDMYWWILPKDKKADLIKIPKPFELGVVFGSLPERAMEFIKKEDDEALKGWLGSFNEATMPGFNITAILPLYEMNSNYSFFYGGPIENQGDQNLPKWQRYSQNTSEVSKSLGKLFNVSPKMMDYGITSFTGGLGRYGLNIADAGLRATGLVEDKTDAKVTPERVPMVKGFVKAPYTSAENVTRFYRDLQSAEQNYQSKAKDMKAKYDLDSKEWTKFLDGKPIPGKVQSNTGIPEGLTKEDMLKLHNMRTISDNMSDARKSQIKVLTNKNFTSSQKHEKVNRINEAIARLADIDPTKDQNTVQQQINDIITKYGNNN